MNTEIKKASEIGFCYGVRRAIDILEKAAHDYGSMETLGAVVHNEQVSQRLQKIGINVIHNVDEIKSKIVAVSSHGVSPLIESQLQQKSERVIDTTCPFVKRAQIAARRLAEAGFYVVIYGEAQHPEVKGILGWAQENGIAILDVKDLIIPEKASRRIGILSQTTQIAENFIQFAKDIIDITLSKDVEIRIMDTICHDIRKRQIVSLELAEKVDLMLVVGGHFSANTKRLAELSSQVTETYLVGTAEEINTEWLKGKSKIGVTSGASTSEQTIDDVIKHLTDSKINME